MCYSHDAYCGHSEDNTGVKEADAVGLIVFQQFRWLPRKAWISTALPDLAEGRRMVCDLLSGAPQRTAATS